MTYSKSHVTKTILNDPFNYHIVSSSKIALNMFIAKFYPLINYQYNGLEENSLN